VVVNNLGYRQTENIWAGAEPGQNIVPDDRSRSAGKADAGVANLRPEDPRRAVVLDVQSGDILALVSSPTINPNDSVQGFPPGEIRAPDQPHNPP